jgi:predicted alpha/beta hydrolase family esterase
MKQVVIIHGGSSFNSYESYIANLKTKPVDYERLKPHQKWKQWIAEQMPEADVLLPTLPNGYNASYNEWKIYFEKLLPFLNTDVRLVGHSLGAMFLAVYLNETALPQPVRQLILISGGYNDESTEELGSFKVTSAKNLTRSAQEIHLFHSKDDTVVPFGELAKFQTDIPKAVSHIFTDRGHFNDATFPELLDILKQK